MKCTDTYLQCCFLKKVGCGTHSNPKFGGKGGVASYIDARKKGSGTPFVMIPSEKELPERRSGSFRHKSTPTYV
jgi:hypothetical protein